MGSGWRTGFGAPTLRARTCGRVPSPLEQLQLRHGSQLTVPRLQAPRRRRSLGAVPMLRFSLDLCGTSKDSATGFADVYSMHAPRPTGSGKSGLRRSRWVFKWRTGCRRDAGSSHTKAPQPPRWRRQPCCILLAPPIVLLRKARVEQRLGTRYCDHEIPAAMVRWVPNDAVRARCGEVAAPCRLCQTPLGSWPHSQPSPRTPCTFPPVTPESASAAPPASWTGRWRHLHGPAVGKWCARASVLPGGGKFRVRAITTNS